MMKIALDYDETFTSAPVLFKLFVSAAKQYGHDIKFVTYRPDNGLNNDIELDAKELGIEIIYTAGKQKRNNFDADIWIDDSPETIPTASQLDGMYKGCIVNNDY